MKVGVVGIGDIAQKAYLPILTRDSSVEPVLMTRDRRKLHDIVSQYHMSDACTSLEDLIQTGVKAAFVHASTSSHYDIVKSLLQSGIHVYVDKPLDENLARTQELMETAERNGLILMVGFNRRYAPLYRKLHSSTAPELVIMQKNRSDSRKSPRFLIYDDFIHVVDTLLYFMSGSESTPSFSYQLVEGKVNYMCLKLSSATTTAIGVMHRKSGFDEERLEVFRNGRKDVVENLSVHKWSLSGDVTTSSLDSWASPLEQKGFLDIISTFLSAVRTGAVLPPRDSLPTHALCERLAQDIEQMQR